MVTETTNNYFGFNHIGIAFDKDGKEMSKSDPVLAQILFDHSAAAFAATLAIKADYDFGNNNLGVYYARLGKSHDPVQAERFFRKAISVNSRYADAFNNLGIVLAEQGRDLAKQGRYDEALVKLEDSARQHAKGLRRAARQGLRPQQPLRRVAGNGQRSTKRRPRRPARSTRRQGRTGKRVADPGFGQRLERR